MMTNDETARRVLMLDRAERRIQHLDNVVALIERASTFLDKDRVPRVMLSAKLQEAYDDRARATAKIEKLYRETVVAEDLPDYYVRKSLLARIAYQGGAAAWCARLYGFPAGPHFHADWMERERQALLADEHRKVNARVRDAMMFEDDVIAFEAAERAKRRGLERDTGAVGHSDP